MTKRDWRPLVVVGGGLAGLAAAIEAQRAGLPTCLVEQRSGLRGPRRLLAEVDESGVETRLDTAAWGIWGRDLALCGPHAESSILAFDQVILATGAFERPVAFPGWTLPGVMTAAGAVRLLEQGVRPGQQVLVAGYGTFVADASAALERGGAPPMAVLDASARRGRLVVRAEGDEHLQHVVTARVERDWSIRPGTEQTIEADALVMAFGSIPEDRLPRLAGCDLLHSSSSFIDPRTARDGWMRTSVPGVLVAGSAGGVVGAETALEQGRLAGLAAAVDAGSISLERAERRARPIRRRLAALESAAAGSEAPRPGLFALADAETIICRCEDVTAREVADRLFEDSFEPAGPIAETRAGMGLCQGRMCASLIAATIARHAGQPLERIPPITPRPPAVPVPLGVLAERPPVFAPR